MTVNVWLGQAREQLEKAGVGTARLDALVLLEDVLARDRAWVLAHPEHEIGAADVRKLTKLLDRRAKHEPLAHVRGRVEFYGREFLLTPAVLVPRPESETMIDLLKDLPLFGVRANRARTTIRVVDIGTGSGALGITAALELSNARVDLLDIDPKALEVAKMNVDKFTLTLNVVKSDLLAQAPANYEVLLCNLPYVPDDFQINLAAAHEPRQAIFGGPDGLDLYRKLFNQLESRSQRPLYILTEALPPQHQTLSEIGQQAGYKVARVKDFIQIFTTA